MSTIAVMSDKGYFNSRSAFSLLARTTRSDCKTSSVTVCITRLGAPILDFPSWLELHRSIKLQLFSTSRLGGATTTSSLHGKRQTLLCVNGKGATAKTHSFG